MNIGRIGEEEIELKRRGMERKEKRRGMERKRNRRRVYYNSNIIIV
jgi:hypothetical protein